MHLTMSVCCGVGENMRCKRADNDPGMSRAITNARKRLHNVVGRGQVGQEECKSTLTLREHSTEATVIRCRTQPGNRATAELHR